VEAGAQRECADLAAGLAARPASATAEAARRAPPVEPSLRARLARGVAEIVARRAAEAEKRSRGAAPRAALHVAVLVRDVASGTELVAIRADAAQRPASNMKLVTTAAALVLLGADAEYVTPLEAAGELQDGVLAGDLVVRGSGDPLVLPDGRGAVEGRLTDLARKLRARGLARVTGDLVLDEGTFLVPGPGPEWPSSNQHWEEFCALSGGFSIHGGVIQAVVTPGKPGGAAVVEVHPVPHGLASAIGVTTSSGGRLDVRVGATARTVTVKGSIPAGSTPFTAEFAHPDPVAYFGSVLAAELARAGISIEGGVRRTRGAPGGKRLGELHSRVADTLALINSESHNAVADQLFLHLGNEVLGRGDRAGGAAAVRAALERLGVPPVGIVQVDGSGLSRADRVTARELVTLLSAVIDLGPDEAELYRGSLALAGRTGTLEERMRGTVAEGRVRAKTGWINGVSALSGLAETMAGGELVFSILVEYPAQVGGLNTSVWKPMQDEILVLLVGEGP
jgi:D-alanyl-D-alanine carboxypeptidase/D-alanyl-D-alanine-endopeptidase (penicillin-binding protein 4)